jgi:transmembrane sensor
MQTKENNQSADLLITGYLEGDLNEGEIQQLINWIKLDKSNKEYFDEFCEIWITARASSNNQKYYLQEGFWKFRQKIKVDNHQGGSTTMLYIFKKTIRYAAVFIIAFSLSGFLFYYLGNKNTIKPIQGYSELVVPMGSKAQYILPDGSSVTLNAGSKLKFDNSYGIKDRVVKLEGEGYFKVARDIERPFVVETPYLNVTALGTEFNIKSYVIDKTVETTLINGSIKIEPVAWNGNDEINILKPNQKITYFKEDSSIIEEEPAKKNNDATGIQPVKVQKSSSAVRLVTENVNIEPVVSWKENRWIFEQQSLEQIAVDLERKFDIQIVFESERLKTFRFTGTIIAEPIEQVLEVMSITAPLSFKLKGRIVTLSENRNFEKRNKTLYNQPD